MRNLRVNAERIAADIAALAAITDPGQPWTRRAFSPRFDTSVLVLKTAWSFWTSHAFQTSSGSKA